MNALNSGTEGIVKAYGLLIPRPLEVFKFGGCWKRKASYWARVLLVGRFRSRRLSWEMNNLFDEI